jgi:hypothetical protein
MKRSVGKWVSSTVGLIVAAAFTLLMVVGLFFSQMATYNDYIACNPSTGISRIEWFLGVRPVENDRWR